MKRIKFIWNKALHEGAILSISQCTWIGSYELWSTEIIVSKIKDVYISMKMTIYTNRKPCIGVHGTVEIVSLTEEALPTNC